MTTKQRIIGLVLVFSIFLLSVNVLAASLSLSLGSYSSEIYTQNSVNIPVVVTASNVTGNADVVLTPQTGLGCDTCTLSYSFTGGTNEQGTVTFTLTGTQVGTYNPPFISVSASSGSIIATPLSTGSPVTVLEKPTWVKTLTASSVSVVTNTEVTITLTITPSGTFEGVQADLALPSGWTLVSGTDPKSIGTISGTSTYQWIARASGLSGNVIVYLSATNPVETSVDNSESVYITIGTSGGEDSVGGSGSGGGAGGGLGGGFWTSTYSVEPEKLATGYTKLISVHQRLRLNIDNEDHYLGLVGLTATTATINVSSKMQQATLTIGQIKKFDVTNDSFYDISVKLNSITGNNASLTVTKIHEQAPVATKGETEGSTPSLENANPAGCTPSWDCSTWSECSTGRKTRVCTDKNNCGTQDGKPAETEKCPPSFPLILILAIFLLAIVGGAIYYFIKKKNT